MPPTTPNADQAVKAAQSIAGTLNDDQKGVVDRLVITIAMQADVIDALSRMLDNFQGADAIRAREISGPALLRIAAHIQSPVVQAPTLAELNRKIDEMNASIASAATAQDVFKTILAFAIKVAPLAI